MIRAATPADLPVLHALIRELADYERALSEAKATEEQLRDGAFRPRSGRPCADRGRRHDG